jgi:hypothetical protein
MLQERGNHFFCTLGYMFGFFKSSKDKIKVIDKVWMTRSARLQACKAMYGANAQCLFIVWFEESALALKQVVPGGAVFLAAGVELQHLQNRLVVFAEHYPLRKIEDELYQRLNLTEVNVLSALDEPLFSFFGGERLQEVMRKMGMGDNEIVGHSMITSAIKNAQQKLEQRVVSEKKAASQEKWFEMNFPA